MDDDLERPGCALPTLATVAIGVLVVIGLFTIIGWAFSLAWTIIRIVLILIVVAGVVTAWRAVSRGR